MAPTSEWPTDRKCSVEALGHAQLRDVMAARMELFMRSCATFTSKNRRP